MGAASLLFPHMASMYGAGSGPGLRRFVETTSTTESGRYDLVIIGGNAGGLSVAISSLRSGIERVRIIEPGHEVAFPELVPENNLDVGFGEQVESIDRDGDDIVVVTDHHTYRARGCLVAQRVSDPAWT
ncbi:MAG: thioredoxin reductase, partial [Candidatus Aldehydirespiratoraceae bacterium]